MKDKETKQDSKTKNKLVIDKYTQPIFPPYDLYICKNFSIEDIQNNFLWEDGCEVKESEISVGQGLTLSFVYKKDDPEKHYAIVILLWPKYIHGQLEAIEVCSHEAAHAVHHILDYCNMELSDKTTETYAFMQGWATKCCYETYKKKV